MREHHGGVATRPCGCRHRVRPTEAPKYPHSNVVFDYGASFAKRLCFRLEHAKFGFGVASIYCLAPAPSGRIDIHEVGDLRRRAALFGVEGYMFGVENYTPPTADELKRDFAAFLQRPAPSAPKTA